MQFAQKQLKPSEFPALLKEIPDAPTLLYMRGLMPSEELKYLCVVGSRACSPYGRRVCASLVAGLDVACGLGLSALLVDIAHGACCHLALIGKRQNPLEVYPLPVFIFERGADNIRIFPYECNIEHNVVYV